MTVDGLLVECRYGKPRLAAFDPCTWKIDLVLYLAIDRVHRLGQDKTVYVTHFLVRCLSIHILFVPHAKIDIKHNRRPDSPNTKTQNSNSKRGFPRKWGW
jgi:hypothetical protein